MGAEREDTQPSPRKAPGTEPGIGPPSGKTATAAPVEATKEEAPPPVDFDALHAALGDPAPYEELKSEPTLEMAAVEPDALLDHLDPARAVETTALRVGESSGQSSATYASARPRTIPPTRAPVEDLNAPPVIIAPEDTVPGAPPHMTFPIGQRYPGHRVATPAAGMPAVLGPMPVTASNIVTPSPGHLRSSSHPEAAAAYPYTPQPFPLQRGAPQLTARMPERPINPRPQKSPTIVVRERGPSPMQKLAAFMAMLVLVTAGGIAMVVWQKPRWLGLVPGGAAPTFTPTSTPILAPTNVPATSQPNLLATASAGPAGAASVSGAGAGSAAPSAVVAVAAGPGAAATASGAVTAASPSLATSAAPPASAKIKPPRPVAPHPSGSAHPVPLPPGLPGGRL